MTISKSVLVIGGGGREHALAYRLSKSNKVNKIFVAPGNGGTLDDNKVVNVEKLDIMDNNAVVSFCKENKIDLVAVGPEIPLLNGITDALVEANILCFGPDKKAALLEGSKAFSKDFMVRHNIPTAFHKSFKNYEDAIKYVESLPINQKVVVKASGLAAGKGVILPNTLEETKNALEQIMVKKEFGNEAGKEVVVEELMTGPEVSLFAFSDGENVLVLPPAQDHKRIFDNDEGPNTGGMGAYCPASIVTPEEVLNITKKCIQPSIDGAKKEGFPFKGLLYCGLMLTPQGPKMLEYNCRFGDPETQAILMLLESDLFDIMTACATGTLGSIKSLEYKKDSSAVTIVLASKGYPGSYPKGKPIYGVSAANNIEGVKVFHAGTKKSNNELVTSGGRVIAVSAVGSTIENALEKAYQGVGCIKFEGMQYRKDIGKQALQKKKKKCCSVVLEDSNLILSIGVAGAIVLGAFLMQKVLAKN